MKNFINKTLNHIASLRVTGALNREQKGRSLFVFPLACLLTALLLALPHCSSDDNGGGGGGGEDSLGAIYLWTTGCTVHGDMNGSGSSPCTLPADAPADGPTRADAICANRYDMVVDMDDRDRIAGEGNPQHTAMLARSNDPPREVFPVRGKDTLEIKRPDGTTLIADSWDQFFDPNFVLGNNIVDSAHPDAGQSHWTGWRVEANTFSPVTSGGTMFYCESSGLDTYWTNPSSGNASVGAPTITQEGRLHASEGHCSNNGRLYCITH